MRLYSIMVGAILSMVVLILVLAFIKSLNEGTRDLVDKQICKQSVEANALFRFDKLAAKTDIECPTIFIKSSATKKNAVFETLALAMADTWDEFLLGRTEIFDTSDENYCVIRRVIQFDKPEKYEGFFDYLLIHDPPNVKMPYFSYLTNVDVTQGTITTSGNAELKSNDVIDTSIPYAAIFILAKKKQWTKLETTTAGAGTGAAVGLLGSYLILTLVAPEIGIPVLLIKFVGGTVLTGGLVGGGYSGALVGYALGSKTPADWQAGMYLVPYTQENLNRMDCTKLPISLTNEKGAASE